MNYQVFDNMISRFMTLLYKRFLTFFSIHSLFQVSSEHACSSAVPRSLLMLLLPLYYMSYPFTERIAQP